MGTVRRVALRAAGGLLPVGMRTSLLRSLCEDLRNELGTKLTDRFLEALLGALDVAFALDSDYRRNIEGFGAVFVFRTRDSQVGATAIFQDGNMSVEREARSRFDTRLTLRRRPTPPERRRAEGPPQLKELSHLADICE